MGQGGGKIITQEAPASAIVVSETAEVEPFRAKEEGTYRSPPVDSQLVLHHGFVCEVWPVHAPPSRGGGMSYSVRVLGRLPDLEDVLRALRLAPSSELPEDVLREVQSHVDAANTGESDNLQITREELSQLISQSYYLGAMNALSRVAGLAVMAVTGAFSFSFPWLLALGVPVVAVFIWRAQKTQRDAIPDVKLLEMARKSAIDSRRTGRTIEVVTHARLNPKNP